jgi:photosystem II stability/assembly factor-like uncharacterized protein
MEGNGFNSISRLFNLKMNFVFPELDLVKKRNRSLSHILFLILCLTSFTFSQQWEFMNGPYYASINVLAIDPINPNNIYAGAIENGGAVFKSTNGGVDWQYLPPTGTTYALVIDPQNPYRIYAGKYRSIDGGQNWEYMNNLGIGDSWALAVDPVNPNNVYAGDLLNSGIWKSTDYGDTWETKNNGIPVGFPHGWIKFIEINPQNPSSIYVGTNLDGVFRTRDGGENWSSFGIVASDFKIDWNDTTIIYRIQGGQLYKTYNSGASWVQCSLNGINMIEIDPVDHLRLYAGWPGVYRSNDGGSTWNDIGNELSFRAGDVADIAVNPVNNNEVYLGTGIGVYKSVDSTYKWQEKFRGLNKALTFDFSIAGSSLYSAVGFGVFSYNDGKWIYKGLSGAMNIAANPGDPSILLASIDTDFGDRLIYRSTDGGKHWSWNGLFTIYHIPIAISDIDPDRVYAGDWRSSDKGASWDTISAHIINGGFAIHPEQSEIVYMCSMDGVYKTYNAGTSWDSLAFLNSFERKSIAVDPTNGDVVYLGFFGEGVYKSINGGYDWFPINNGLTNLQVMAIGVHPVNANQIFIAVYDGGVFQSNNGGGDWFEINDNLPNLAVTTLAVDTHYVYIGYNMDLEGVYRREIITSIEEPGVSQKPVSFQLFQNYPNPFNSTTAIPFELGQSGHISLKIFNILGEEVITLLDKNLFAGRHSVSWNGRSSDGREVSSGVYFYRLKAGDAVQLYKMLVVR